ncbi:hypothetical protein [Streptomyces sp. HO565]|uniref:hypothetical protein n=1 Tax=Streptomyces sp. HO565 TaxID=2857489 RepID=UPI0034DC810D
MTRCGIRFCLDGEAYYFAGANAYEVFTFGSGSDDTESQHMLVRAWITDSHEKVGKPFFMGEFNSHNVDRAAWWSEIYADFEAAGGDGSAFWFGVTQGRFGTRRGPCPLRPHGRQDQ